MRILYSRWLSPSSWLRTSFIRLFCLVFVVWHYTCQVDCTNNTSRCHCDSSRNNATTVKNETQACNCSGSSINCTSGFHYVNNTCVQCSCNTTKLPSNCNCSHDQESGQKVFCGPGYFLANASEGIYCRNCSCNMETSVSNICDNKTGQCLCKPYVIGRQCNICASNYSASYSRTGNLMNCSQEQGKCPAGFNRTVKSDPPFYECVEQQNSTVIPDKTSQVVSTNAPITTNKLHSSTASTSRGKHSSTNHPTSMPRSTHRTDYSSTGSSTTHGNTGSKTPEKEQSNRVVMIVMITIGVLLLIAVAVAVAWWYLRVYRKPSTPYWTVELSHPRGDNLDFNLLDPVTDQPHREPNEDRVNETNFTENSRYCAYI